MNLRSTQDWNFPGQSMGLALASNRRPRGWCVDFVEGARDRILQSSAALPGGPGLLSADRFLQSPREVQGF